jgi:hypothetical protein
MLNFKISGNGMYVAVLGVFSLRITLIRDAF